MDGLRATVLPSNTSIPSPYGAYTEQGVGGRGSRPINRNMRQVQKQKDIELLSRTEAIHSPGTTQICPQKEPHEKRRNWPHGRTRNGIFSRWKYTFTSMCSEDNRGRRQTVIKP